MHPAIECIDGNTVTQIVRIDTKHYYRYLNVNVLCSISRSKLLSGVLCHQGVPLIENWVQVDFCPTTITSPHSAQHCMFTFRSFSRTSIISKLKSNIVQYRKSPDRRQQQHLLNRTQPADHTQPCLPIRPSTSSTVTLTSLYPTLSSN